MSDTSKQALVCKTYRVRDLTPEARAAAQKTRDQYGMFRDGKFVHGQLEDDDMVLFWGDEPMPEFIQGERQHGDGDFWASQFTELLDYAQNLVTSADALLAALANGTVADGVTTPEQVAEAVKAHMAAYAEAKGNIAGYAKGLEAVTRR